MEGDWLRARQRLQGIRRRRRERPHRIGGAAGLAWRTSMMSSNLGSGHTHPSAQQHGSSTESNFTCSTISRGEENSIPKEAMVRHSSSSVIAKLMRLDEPAPCRLDPKQQKITCMWPQNPSSGVFQDKYSLEMIKTSEAKKKNLPSSSCNSTLTFSSRNFIGENFSTYDSLERTRENNEVAEDQNSYEVCAVEVQQQSSSVFRKDLQNPKWFELSHHSRQTTNAKSLNGTNHENRKIIYKFGGKAGRSLLNNAKRSNKNLAAVHVLHSLRDQRAYFSHTFAKVWHSDKNDACTQRSKIVLLKPSVDMAASKRRRDFVLANSENISLCKRRQTTHSIFVDAKRSSEDRMPTYVKTIGGRRSKGSREVAREITQYMRRSMTNYYREDLSRSLSKHFKDEIYVFSRYNLHKHDPSRKSPGLFSAQNRSYSSSIASSTEFMRKDASNEKMSYQSEETLHHGSCTRTLGEMFALSDKEASCRKHLLPTANRNSDLRSSPSANKPTKSHYLSSFSNPNMHKDWHLINLPKYASLSGFPRNYGTDDHLYAYKDMPSLRHVCRNIGRGGSPPNGDLRNGSNKFHSFKFIDEENKLPLHQMPTQTEELEKESYLKSPEFNVFNFSDDCMADSGNDLFVSYSSHVNTFLEKSMDISLQSQDKDITSNDEISCDNQEKSFDSHWIDGLSIHMDGMEVEPQSPGSSNEAVQSSPVSILDLPLVEDNSDLTTHCHILKLDSDDACSNKEEVRALNKNEEAGDFQSLQPMDNMEDEFINDEERDFSYLLDMLIDSGIYGADQYKLYSTGCLLKFPVGFGVFEKLEKKYSKMVIWLRSERKLFFDLINSILAEILAPCIDMHPWVNSTRKIGPMWGSEGLLERAWQIMIRKREELGEGKAEDKVLDGPWFSLGDDIDELGWEIERMILEELLDELLREL